MTESLAVPGDGPVRARVDGGVAGATVAGAYQLILARDLLHAEPELSGAPSLAVTLGTLDGAGYASGVLTLALPGGDALDLESLGVDAAERAAFDAFAARVVARAYAIPELTRALRTFAATRGAPGSDHDRFFAPLIDALRRARDVLAIGGDEPWSAVEAVDSRRVVDDLRAAFAALAAERGGEGAAPRRALEAELEDVAGPLLATLAVVDQRATAVLQAPGDLRLVAWRGWTEALAQSFRAADLAWEAAVPALADPRGGMGRLWRSLLRQRGAGT